MLAAFVLASVVGGCADEEAPVEIAKTVKMDLRSDLVFDQVVSFDAKTAERTQRAAGATADKAGGAENLRRKKSLQDPQFQALNRFEFPVPRRHREVAGEARPETKDIETVQPRDKKLIFASEGFALTDFEASARGRLNTDFYSYVRPIPPEHIKKRKPQPIDLQEENLRADKNLIFHSSFASSAGGKNLTVDEPENKSPASRDVTIPPEKIPQTKILLTQKPEALLKLQPDKNALDLLVGNEKIILKQFRNR